MEMRYLIILLFTLQLYSQNIWHVKPYGGNLDYSIATSHSGLTYDDAWTLREALEDVHGSISAGDIIYLHGNISTPYQGHFTCTIDAGNAFNYVTIKSYPGDFAVINGNIYDGSYSIPSGMDTNNILFVTGKYIQFENFRITCLGNFTRMKDPYSCFPNDLPATFHEYTGLRHDPTTEAPCKFINMMVDNIPGVGFASWKETVDTEIYGCIMYYNGYIMSLRPNCSDAWQTHNPPGVNVNPMENCIYTQSSDTSTLVRKFKNNIFSNNYKSGIAIWSAATTPTSSYLSHYDVEENIFVNNAGPVRGETPNMLINSATLNANNHPSDIDVNNNVFYFNSSNDISGITTLNNTDVRIEGNEFYNGTAAVELSETNKKMKFNNNYYVGKRIKVAGTPSQFNGSGIPADAWEMDYNLYYTRNPGNASLNNNMFLIPAHPTNGATLTLFKTLYSAELHSNQYDWDSFTPLTKNNIFQNTYNPYRFHVTIYNSVGTTGNVNFDFSAYGIPDGMAYTIRDAEDYHNLLASDTYDAISDLIPFNVSASPGFEMPRPLASSGKISYITQPVHSATDFRVYVLEFSCEYPYDILKSSTTVSTTENYSAQNNIKFGSAFTATSISNITAKAGNEILFVNNCDILSDNGFLARIEPVTCPEFIMPSARLANHSSVIPKDDSKAEVFPDMISIYPNPNSGIFKVECLNEENITKVIIFSVDTGREVFNHAYDIYEKMININITDQPSGIYSVQIYSSGEYIVTKKIIKK